MERYARRTGCKTAIEFRRTTGTLSWGCHRLVMPAFYAAVIF
jgi:hypothetical protein